jgi:hypothetical protein
MLMNNINYKGVKEMAKITIEELSGSLKEYLNGLGLTEAQVQELIDKFEDEKIGDISQLSTEEKGSLVGAINELFQNANNGKQLIADAIGSPLTEGDTFAAMGNSINRLTTDFRNALALKGVNAPGDKFETLINRIDEIVQSGNVLNNQVMISGEYVAPEDYIPRGGYDKTISIELNLDFDPEYFFIYFSNLGNKNDSNLNSYTWTESVILSTDCPEVLLHAAYTPSGYGGSDTRFRLSYDRTTANITLIKGSYGSYAYVKQGDIIRWYAIGSSQLPNNGGERTITPSTTDQVLPDGYYSGDITVKGDSDLKPENIVEGVEIFGVTGNVKKGSSQFSAMYNNDVFKPLYYTQNGVEKVLYLTAAPDTYKTDIPVKCFNDMLTNDYATHTLLNIDRDNTHFAIDDKIYYWEAAGNVNLYTYDRTTSKETSKVIYSSNYGAHQLAICVGTVIHLIGGYYWSNGDYGSQGNRNYISIFDPANNTITKVGTEPTDIHLSDGYISFKLRDSLYLIHDVNDSMYASAANFFIYDSNTYTITKITHNITDFRDVHVARVSDTELKLCSAQTGKLYDGYLNLTDLTLNIVEVPCPLKIESVYHDAGKIFAISGGVLIHLN